MKNSIGICSAVLLMALPFFTGCTRPEIEFHDETNEIINRHQTFSDRENIQYLADMEEFRENVIIDIEANNKCISELKKGFSEKEKSVRLEKMELLDQLERQNNNMRFRMNDYTGDGIASWYSFKAEFSSDMKTLSNSLNILKSSNLLK